MAEHVQFTLATGVQISKRPKEASSSSPLGSGLGNAVVVLRGAIDTLRPGPKALSNVWGCSLFDLKVVVLVPGPGVEYFGWCEGVVDEGDHGVVDVVAG
jgi:hypothetical protein